VGPVDFDPLSPVCIPCENGLVKGIRRLVPRSHTAYDYNEVF